MCAQFLHRLIYGESGRISGDLKKDSTWLVKVDRVEVLAIHDRSYVAATIEQVLTPVKLVCIVLCTPGNMMNCAHCNPATRLFGQAQNIDDSSRTTSSGLIAEAIAFLLQRTETEHVGKHGCRLLLVILCQRHAIEAANGIGFWHRSFLPAATGIHLLMRNQLQRES